MDLNHLHLHVRDLDRATRFYESFFGFQAHARHGEIVFLRNADGFDLALAPDPNPAALPAWFHFGFRLPSPADVRSLHARAEAEGATIRRRLEEHEDMVFFRLADPDGYAIEVYWE